MTMWKAEPCTAGTGTIADLNCSNSQRLASRDSPEINTTKKIKISPIPAINIVTISDIELYSVIELYNSLGKLISKKISKDNSYDLDLTMLPSGIYILKVSGKDAEKIIKIDE